MSAEALHPVQDHDELAIWLALHSLAGPGLGSKGILALVGRFLDVKELWHSSKEQLVTVAQVSPEFAASFIGKREAVDPEKLLDDLKRSKIQALPYNHPFYPPLLRQIHDPPTVLFLKGRLDELDFQHAVGVVGTRRPSSYGMRLAKDVGRGLSADGVIVCSGMALGVDSLAHWGAIEGGGRTIAVVATGPDICYPSSNKKLYEAILDGRGVVISEYFPATKPEKWHFPARNRIVSGISKALVVVEAGETSGALITAKLAFEQNRDVYAFPGRVDSPMSVGTNSLIRQNMAQSIRHHGDVLDNLSWAPTTINETRTIMELFGREKEIYDLLSTEPTHFDVLCQHTGISAGELSASLTMLELGGLISRLPGDWYLRQDTSRVSLSAH